MGAQRGKDLLLKLRANAASAFETVGGMRTKQLNFNAETVDVTNADSAGQWRELLDSAGLRRASLSGAGIFKNSGSDAAVRALFFDGAIRSWQIVIPEFGFITGLFQIVSLTYGGNHTNELTFDIALESAGEIAFEAL